jgi:ankyrin repeat protein
MHKQYFGIVFSISLIAQPMMAAHMSEIDWKGTPQQSIGLLLKPNRKGIEKITPLSKAVVQGNARAVKKLIDAQSNPQAKAALVNSFGADPYQVTPLHYAAAKENTEIITILLTAGANPNAQDSSQCTPLMWAISNGKDKAATLLASKTDLTIRDNLGRTALHWAAAKVNQAVATTLLSQGAAVRAKDNQGNTPLHYVVSVKYRFGHHDPQDDAGAAMSGKFVQAAAIATAGMQPTQQNQAIMNKMINLGMATPVTGVASFAGGKGSGVVMIAPNAQGTGVNAIGMPVSDTANPTSISPDTATIVNSSQASPTEVLQAASGASAQQDASGVAAQADASPTSAKSSKSVTNKPGGKARWSAAKKSVPSQIDIDAIDIHTHVGNEGDVFWNSSFTAADLQPKQTYINPAYNPNSPSLYKNMPSQAAAAPAIPPEEALNNATQAYFNNNPSTVANLNAFAGTNSRTITYNQSTTYDQLTQELNDIKGQVAQYSGKGLAADEITALNNEKTYIKLLSQAVDAVQSEVSPSVMQQVQKKIVSLLPVSKKPAASTRAVQQPASSELAREESSTELLKMEETVPQARESSTEPDLLIKMEETGPSGMAETAQSSIEQAAQQYFAADPNSVARLNRAAAATGGGVNKFSSASTFAEDLQAEQARIASMPKTNIRVLQYQGYLKEAQDSINPSPVQDTRWEQFIQWIQEKFSPTFSTTSESSFLDAIKAKLPSFGFSTGEQSTILGYFRNGYAGAKGKLTDLIASVRTKVAQTMSKQVTPITSEATATPVTGGVPEVKKIPVPEINNPYAVNLDEVAQEYFANQTNATNIKTLNYLATRAGAEKPGPFTAESNYTQLQAEQQRIAGLIASEADANKKLVLKNYNNKLSMVKSEIEGVKTSPADMPKVKVVKAPGGPREKIQPSQVEQNAPTPSPEGSGVVEYNPQAFKQGKWSAQSMPAGMEPEVEDVGGVSLETPTVAEAAQGVAKPGVIGQAAYYLNQVAFYAWDTIPSGVIKGGMEAGARLVSQAAGAVMSSISDATTAAANAAGNAFFGALTEAGVSLETRGAIYGAGEAAGKALGTTVGEAASALGYEGVIDASVADIPVVDIVMILATALQLAIQYGMQAQEKTDQRNKRAEIDGRRDNIITALLKKDTKTITNNNNPYVSDFPAYLTANSKGRVPSHFAAMSGNSGPQQLINKLVNDPTVLTVVDNAGYTPLMYAIMRGRKDNLNPSGLSNVMLAQGFTKNTNATGTKTFVNPTNVTPLKTSLMFGGGKLFDAIFTIVHTSDVYTDIVGRNILHYAALDGKQIEKVYKAYSSVSWYTCLVSSTSSETGPYRKMDPNANPWVTSQDMYGATPLHYAAATSANGFKFLLAKAGKVDLTTLLDKNGMTVLHYAAMCGRVEVIHEAMKHAGNKKKRDAFGEIKSKTTDTYGNAITPNLADKTAIDLASISGHPQAVRVLAKHVAESKTEKQALLAEAKQSKRATAQQTKQQEKVSKGQSRVAKLQMREAKSKVMIDPLIAGVKAGRGNVVLAYNQPSNLTATESGTGMTALMYAVKEGREQMVKQILDALKQQNLTAEVLAMTDAKGETASAMTKNKKIQAMLTQAASSTVAGGVVTGTPTPTTTKAKKATSVIGRKTTNLPMNQR